MTINPEEVQQIMNEARNCMSAQNVAPEILENCFDPVVNYLIQSAQNSEAKIRAQQIEYKRLVYELLKTQKAFDWGQISQQAAFEKDIDQYEEIIAHSISTESPDMLDWTINYHTSIGMSDTVGNYKDELERRRQLMLQSMADNSCDQSSIHKTSWYYDRLINSSFWYQAA